MKEEVEKKKDELRNVTMMLMAEDDLAVPVGNVLDDLGP